MVGNDFWNGAEESPYCNKRFLKSCLPKKLTPCNSETSRSSQFAAGNNSVMEKRLEVPEPFNDFEFL